MAFQINVATGVLLLACLISGTFAEDVLRGSQCIISNSECTCSEQPATGTCTRQVGKDTCLQGECLESFRCDCWGFEKCSITTCGKHVPISSANLSTDIAFQCKLEADGSQCRNPTGYMDTSEGAENARDASVAFVDEAVVDEREVAIELAAAMNYKMTVLEAIRSLDHHYENVTDDEIRAISEDAELVAVAVQEIMIDLAEVSQESKVAYDHMADTKAAMRAAKVAEEASKAVEAKRSALEAESLASSTPCTLCEELKREAERLNEVRRQEAKDAGKSAKKARDARKRTRRGRRSAQEKNEATAAAKHNCEEKVRRVLARLQALSSAPTTNESPTTAPVTTVVATTTEIHGTFQF